MVESIEMAAKRKRARPRREDAEIEARLDAMDRRLEAISREMRELAARLDERTRLYQLARRGA